MPFKLTAQANERNTPVANDLVDQLNQHVKTAAQMQVAKIAISDQADGDARGVLYYWSDEEPPTVTRTALSWAFVTFQDNEDYSKGYKHVLEFLNGDRTVDGVTLTLQQAAAARVGFANRKKGDFHLTVFYPSQLV